MTPNLETTNLMLGIIAAVSVLEALLVIGMGIAGFRAYRRVMTVVEGLEARHIQPAMTRVNGVLDNLQSVSATVKEETDRVDHALRSTVNRVDATAQRVRADVRLKTRHIVGFLIGLRAALEALLEDREVRHVGEVGLVEQVGK
jgi:hypothetical protein